MAATRQYGAVLTGAFDRQALRRMVETELSAVVQSTQKLYVDTVRKHFAAGKTGRAYYRNGRIHIASAPGEPPAIDSGKLNKSIRTRFLHHGTRAQITFNTDYASTLEEGRKDGVMKPRPYAQRTLDEVAPLFVAQLRKRLGALRL